MNNNKQLYITTVDNPYDPSTQWKQWLLFDVNSGYNTCGRLASITFISDSMTEEEIYDRIEHGMNQLIKTGSINKYGDLIEYKKLLNNNN